MALTAYNFSSGVALGTLHRKRASLRQRTQSGVPCCAHVPSLTCKLLAQRIRATYLVGFRLDAFAGETARRGRHSPRSGATDRRPHQLHPSSEHRHQWFTSANSPHGIPSSITAAGNHRPVPSASNASETQHPEHVSHDIEGEKQCPLVPHFLHVGKSGSK